MLTFADDRIVTLNLGGCVRCDSPISIGDVVLFEYPLAYCADCAPGARPEDDTLYLNAAGCGCEDYPCCGH